MFPFLPRLYTLAPFDSIACFFHLIVVFDAIKSNLQLPRQILIIPHTTILLTFLCYNFLLLDVLHALDVLHISCEVIMVLQTGPIDEVLSFFLLFRYNSGWLWFLVEGKVEQKGLVGW